MGTVQGPTSPVPVDRKPKPSFLEGIFLRLKEIFLLGGVGLIVIAAFLAGSPEYSPTGEMKMAGLAGGLAVAGGLCFVATALVYRGGNGRS
jgi:hypothetical protein